MKKSKLERFIRDHRNELEVYEPSDALWERIELQLPPSTNTDTPPKTIGSTTRWIVPRWNIQSYWRMAAMISVLLGGSVWYYQQNNSMEAQTKTIAYISPQYAQVAVNCVSAIEEKQEELSEAARSNPTLYKNFKTELSNLEQNYQSLRKELATSPNQELIVEAMVQNLQQQIQVLDTQISVIQRINHYKEVNEKHHKNITI